MINVNATFTLTMHIPVSVYIPGIWNRIIIQLIYLKLYSIKHSSKMQHAATAYKADPGQRLSKANNYNCEKPQGKQMIETNHDMRMGQNNKMWEE